MSDDVTDEPDQEAKKKPERSLAFWCTLLLFLITISPWVTLILILPTTGPSEAKTLMGPVLTTWPAFASPIILVLGGIAGYDKYDRSKAAAALHDPPDDD